MMKKILALAASTALTLTALFGCTPNDVALYKALNNEPETSVTKMAISYDVTIEDPLSVVDNYTGDSASDEKNVKLANYVINLLGGLLSLVDVDATVTKSGDVQEAKLTYNLPDASASFNCWVKESENGSAQVVYALPSYVRPFLPENVAGKQYLSINSGDIMNMLFGLNTAIMMRPEPDISVIGGADGPTAVFVTPKAQNDFVYTTVGGPSETQLLTTMLTAALEDEDVINQLASVIDVNLVTEARNSGSDTVYTVKLNAENLQKLARDVISTLRKPELLSVLGLLTGMPTESADAYGSIEIPDETEAYVNRICTFIADSGLLDKGLELAVTVNPQGYVTNVDEDFELNVDAAKLWDAIVELMAGVGDDVTAEDVAEVKASMTIGGKFKLAVKATSQVTDINRPVTVNFPQLTEVNSIDYAKDLAEFSQYQIQKAEFENTWNDYGEIIDYGYAHKPGDPLVLRNDDTGVEVATVPITTAEAYPDEAKYTMSVYVPLTDMAAVLPGISYAWNSDLMGVEVRYYDTYGNMNYGFYPTEAGTEIYLATVYGEDGDDYNEDTVYSGYDYVNTYGLFHNGTFYVEYDLFNYDLGYSGHLEDGKYCYTATANTKYQGEEPTGNFFYEMERLFQ